MSWLLLLLSVLLYLDYRNTVAGMRSEFRAEDFPLVLSEMAHRAAQIEAYSKSLAQRRNLGKPSLQLEAPPTARGHTVIRPVAGTRPADDRAVSTRPAASTTVAPPRSTVGGPSETTVPRSEDEVLPSPPPRSAESIAQDRSWSGPSASLSASFASASLPSSTRKFLLSDRFFATSTTSPPLPPVRAHAAQTHSLLFSSTATANPLVPLTFPPRPRFLPSRLGNSLLRPMPC